MLIKCYHVIMSIEETIQQIRRSKFWRDKKIAGLLYPSVCLNFANLIYICFKFFRITNEIPLHYSTLFGVDSVGQWYKLLTIPLIGLGILGINSVLAFYFYLRGKTNLTNLLLGALLAVQIILLISILLISNL